MMQDCSAADRDQVIDTMISLTRLSNLHRAIVAGSGGTELYLALRRRGFARVAMPETSRLSKGQITVALVTARQSLADIEAALMQVSHFLAANATIAVLIDTRDKSLRICTKLQQMGFRIEAGVHCRSGLVLSACRQAFIQLESAA